MKDLKKFKEFINEDSLYGGVGDSHTIESLAKLHDVSVQDIENQLKIGIDKEKVHTDNDNIARELAMDNLVKDPYYYTRTNDMGEYSKSPTTEGVNMKYIKTFESFVNETYNTIELVEVPANKAMFDSGYNSPNIKGDTKFYEIKTKEDGVIGEFEWGQVDKDTVEIVSLFIKKEFRKNKSGRNSFDAFLKKLNNPKVILKATPQSKGYWKHLGFKLMPGTKDYYQYN